MLVCSKIMNATAGVRRAAMFGSLFLALCAAPPAVQADESAGTAACAADFCTVSELLKLATSSHPLVLAAREGLASFEARYRAAGLTWLPSAKSQALVSATPEKWGSPELGGTTYDEWGPYIRFELSGTLPLYTFGKLSHLREMAKEGLDVGRAQVQIAQSSIELMTLQAFYGRQLAGRVDSLLGDGEKYLGRARTYLERLRDEDSEDYDDVDMLRLKVYESEVAVYRLDARRMEELSKSALLKLTGLSVEALGNAGRLQVSEVELKTLADYVQVARGARGEFLALEAALRAQGHQVTIEKRMFLPDFFIGGFFTYARAFVVEQQPSPFAYDPYNSWFAGAGLGMQLNLDPARRLLALDEANAQVRKLRAQHRALTQQISMEVEKAFAEARDHAQRLKLAKKAHKAARGWVVARLDTYEAGMGTFRDLADGLGAFFKQRLAYEQAKMDFNVALAQLAHACGLGYLELTGSE